MDKPEGEFVPGRVLLGKYRIDGVLGRGGMGTVLKVVHQQLGEELALKVLSSDGVATPDLHARFMREAQALVRLRGEHVARVSDVGVLTDGTPYMVMEYLRGLDLAAELERRGRLFPGESVDYMLQACEALAEAHALGVIHRDIKPANLFLTTRPDGTPLVKVLDFGIAKAQLDQATLLTKTDMVMGTTGYMSPEQMKASKEVDARTDVWALGIVLYECLTGRRPFAGDSFLAVAMMAGTEPAPPMETWVQRPLQAVVLRCLEKDRDDRYGSVAALAAALAPFARDQRAAGLIVERATAMQKGVSSGRQVVRRADSSAAATTLSGSARAFRSGTHRRRTVAGAIALLGSVTLLTLAWLLVTERWKLTSEPTSEVDRSDGGIDPSAASAPLVVGGELTAEQRDRRAKCAEQYAQRKWEDLLRCADELDRLGAHDPAQQFRGKATVERASEVTDAKCRQAIVDGRLADAQGLLRGMNPASVYFRPLGETFEKAEAAAADEARRKASGLAKARDCVGLMRYVAVLRTTSTDVVATAAQDVPCGRSGTGAGAATGATGGGGSTAGRCEPAHVEQVAEQARAQASDGHAAGALSMMLELASCTLTPQMVEATAVYACAAHDLAKARRFAARLSATLREQVERRCELEGLQLADP
ncbi:MAG TPA: serine/threonine-protein kinase [Kofleriaceae bacterium]|nr:serine/threonine-protein kinase [Kofleriaceae bacterium]